MTIVDKNRRDPILTRALVDDVLPEWFQTENPKLLNFLKNYEDFLDSDGGDFNFHQKIQDLFTSRDISDTTEDFLDEIITEVGNGLKKSSFFENPRQMIRLLAYFYQRKGTLISVEAFFKRFFEEEVDISYPKKDLFILNESPIGFESNKKIQNNKRFQILSILVKSGISVKDYEKLYKKFIHPAGFYFSGEVLLKSEANLELTSTQNEIISVIIPSFSSQVSFELSTSFGETTLLDEDSNRIGISQSRMRDYRDISMVTMDQFYNNIREASTPNSYTFDDSSNIGPDFSMTTERMDNDIFDDLETFYDTND